MSARHRDFVLKYAPRICQAAKDYLMRIPKKVSFAEAYKRCDNIDFLQFISWTSLCSGLSFGDADCNCSLPSKERASLYKKKVPWAEFKKHLTGVL